MKKFIFILSGIMLAALQTNAQNSLNSGDFSTGSWNVGQAMSASAGGSLIITKGVTSIGDKFFRFYGDGSPCGEYQPNTNGDAFIHSTVVTTPNGNCGNTNAWKINVPTTASQVVFKTDGNNTGISQSVAFVIQGTIQTVSNVYQNAVIAGSATTITAVLSGSLSTGQAVYLRYTTNAFAASTVVQMTGSGTTYTADIPAGTNVQGNTVQYYVFTSGDANVASNGSNADLFTINLNNNSGANYSYVVTSLGDAFNRTTISPGNNPTLTYTATNTGSGSSSIVSNYLQIANGTTTAGRSFITYPLTSVNGMNTTLSSNTGPITWTFNARTNRTTLGGFGASSYAMAVVLASSNADPYNAGAQGYAAVMYTTANWRLVRFTGGLGGTMTDVINGGADLASITNYASVRIVYTPSSNTWQLFTRDDGNTAWADPASGVTTQRGSNTVDNTYTSTAMSVGAFLWNYSTAATQNAQFDNFRVNVAPIVAPSITSIAASAPGSGTSGYVGNTVTVTGSGFTGVTIVRVGGSGGTNVATFTVVNDNTITFPAIAASGAIYVQNTAGNATSGTSYTNLGYITNATGTWQTAATWLGGAVPPSANTTDVTIAHNVTGTTGTITVRNLTVNSAITLTNTAAATIDINGASTNSGTITNNGTISVTGVTYTNSGTFTVGNGGTFQINQGGFFTGTAISYNATASTLVFNNTSGQYGVATTHVYWPATNGPVTVTAQGAGGVQLQTGVTRTVTNLNLAAGFDIQAANLLTVNGNLQINTGGGITSNPPIYGGASTLIYNTTSNPYGVAAEWTGNATTAGAGVPQNVTIQNSNNVSMPNGNRGLAGNLLIQGTSTLTLNATTGDLHVAGNVTNNSNFVHNSRALVLNGTGAQAIAGSFSTAGTTNNLAFLILNNTGGSITTNTSLLISGTSGSPLQLLGGATFNIATGLNVTMSGTGGSIQVTGGTRTINFASNTATFIFTGAKSVTSTSGGLLSFTTAAATAGASVQLNGAGVDFGASLTTIGNLVTLIVNNGGFVNTNPVTYATGSTLSFRTGATYTVGTGDRTWGPGTTGAGVPFNVDISTNAATNVVISDDRTARNIVTLNVGTLTNNTNVLNISTTNTTGANALAILGGTLANGGGTINIGPSGGGNQSLSLTAGAFNLTAGTVNINGRFIHSAGTFTMSGTPALNIDPNSGTLATSVPVATTVWAISGTATTTVSGGTITVVDPPNSGSALTLTYSSTTTVSWAGSTLVLGGSTGTNTTTATSGFGIDCFVSSGRLVLGNVTVNGGNTTDRFTAGPGTTADEVVIGGTLTINSGSELRIGASDEFYLRGNVVNNGTLTSLNTAAPTTTAGALHFSQSSAATANTTAQTVTGSGVFRNSTTTSTASFQGIEVNNTAAGVAIDFSGITQNLSASVGTHLVAGAILLASNQDFTYTSTTATNTGTSGYFIVNGTGRLKKAFATGASSFVFRIGENTGTQEYSPVTLSISANGTARTLGVIAIDAAHPQVASPLPAVNYLSRYWSVSDDQTTSITGTATMTYIGGADPTGDVNGTETSIKAATYSGGAWNQVTGSIASPILTSGSIVASTGLNNFDITGRDNPGTPYTWVGTTDGSWSTATNWSPNGVPGAQDQVTISSPGTNTLNLTTAVSVTNFIVSGTGDFTIASTGSLTVTGTVTSTTSATPTLNCASTFTMSGATAQTIPAWNYGNLNAAGGNRTWVNGSTTSICGNFTPGAGTYTTTGSTVNFNGTTAQSILTNASNFSTLNITNTTSTVTAALGCTVGTALSISTGGTFIQSTGVLTVSNATVTVNGTLRNSSTSDIVQTGATVNVNGTYDHNRNGGAILVATWGVGSNMSLTGITATVPTSGLNQAFSDVTVNSAFTGPRDFGGQLSNIGRDLNINGTNGFTLQLTTAAAYTGTIGRNLNITAGFLTVVNGANTNNVSLAVGNNISISGAGGLTLAGASASGAGTAALTVTGSVSNGSTSGTSLVFNASAKTATVNIGTGYTHTSSGTASINQSTGATTVNIASGGFSLSTGVFNAQTGGAGGSAILNLTTGNFTQNSGTYTANSGAGTSTLNVTAGNFLLSTGTFNVQSSTGSSTVNIPVGNFTQNGGVFNMVSASTGLSALNINSSAATMSLTGGTFNLLGASAGAVTAGNRPIVTLAGNFSQSGAHAFEFSATGSTASANPGELRVAGNITRTGSSYIRNTAATANSLLLLNGTTQSYDATGLTGNFNYVNVTVSNGTTLTLLSDLTLSVSNIMTVLSGGTLVAGTWTVTTPGTGTTFALNAGGTLSMGSPFGITTSTTGASGGNIQTNTRTFTAGCNLIYAGSANQVSGNAQPASIANLTIANTGGSGSNVVTLTNAATVTGTLTLTSGLLQLGANDLTVSTNTAGAVSGGSGTAFVQTNSTGRLIRSIANTGLPITYNFPVGTSTDYTPASYTFSSNATAFSLGARAVAGTHPQMNSNSTQVDYLANRYWATSTVGSPSTYAYTSTYTFISGDAQGTAANIKLNRWSGTVWAEDAGSSVGGLVLSSGSLSESTGSLSATAEWTGRVNPSAVTYTWNGSTDNSWNTGTNWTPNGVPGTVDNVVISAPGTNGLILSGTLGITDFTVSGTGTFTSDNTATLTINGNVSYSSSASVTLDCASNIVINNAAPQTIPAWNFGNLNATGGNRTLSSTGTIGICGTFTPGAGVYTIAGSTVDFNGTGNQTLNLFNFHNLTISGARSAATVTLPSGTIGVAGNFSVTATGTSYTTTGNTVDFNGTGAQTIGAFGSFNNLTVSGNKGANTVTFGTGTVGIGGTFSITATNATYSTTGNTIDFTSAGAQTIVSFTGFRYNNLSNSGNGARTLVNSPAIVIDGVYTPTSGALTIGTSTIDFGSASSQPMPATNYYNITNSGNGARVWASSGIIDINNNFTPSTGVNTITGSTVRYSSTAAGPFTMSAINSNVAGSSYNNLTIAGSNATPTVFQVGNGVTIGVAGNLTMTSGTLRLATTSISGTVNVLGNLLMNAGTISLSNSGNLADAGVLNLYGDVSFTGGTVSRATSVANGTVNFVKSTGVQLLSYSATSFTILSGFGIPFNVGNGTTTNTVQLTTNFTSGSFTMNVLNNASVDFGTFVLSGSGSFAAASGGTVITANTAGLASSGATGSVQTTGRTFNAAANYVYNGASAQITGTAVTAANDLTINNTAGVTLTSATTLSGNLTLSNGTLTLGANNLTVSNSSASAVTGGSSSNFVITNSTGLLIRAIPASIASSTTYDFPIGLSSGNYSPASFAFTSTTNAFNLQARVVTGTHPQMTVNGAQTDYFANRYFVTNTTGTPGAYAYTSSFTFVSGDAQGTAANIKLNRWGGPWTEDAGSSTSGNVVTSGALTETTGSLTSTAEWTGRVNPTITTYTWNGSVDGSWTNPANWSPATSVAGPTFIDNIIISSPGSNVLTLTTTQSITNVTVSGSGDFTLASSGQLTVTGTLTSTTSATPSFDCASTFAIANTSDVTVPAWNYGNLNLTGGNRTFASSGTISICGTLSRGAGTYTVTGSTVDFNGTGAQTIPVGAYNNLTISQNRGGAAVTLASGTIGVAGIFNPSVSNFTNAYTGNTIDFSSASTQSIPAFFYNNITNTGNGARTWANSGVIDINNNFSPGSGVQTITGSTVRYSSTAATAYTLASFTSNVASRQYNNLELVGGASTTWTIGSGVTLGIAGNFSITGSGTLTVSNGAAASGLTIDGTYTQSSGNVVVANSASSSAGTVTVVDDATISGGVLTIVGSAAVISSNGTFTANNLNISGTGQLIMDTGATVAAATVNANGNFSLTSTTTNAVNFGSGASNNTNNIINIKGNFTKSGTGTIGLTGGFATTAYFNFNGTGTQTFSYSGAAQTSGGYQIAAGSTLQLLTNLTTGSNANTIPFIINGTLDAGNFSVIAGNASNTFTLAATGIIRTSNASGIGGTISSFAGTNTWNAGGTFHFTGAAQSSGFAAYANISSTSAYNLIWAGSTSLTLDKSMTFASANLSTDGLVYLGSFSVTIAGGGSVSGAFSASRMFVTDGSGAFIRVINTTGATTVAYLWPIGEMTGGANYSPVNIATGGLSTTTSTGSIGFRVIDAIEPNNGPVATYISRYWAYTMPTSLGTYSFTNISFTYDAGDVVGTEASLKLNSWSTGSSFWTQYASSSAASNVITLTSGMSGTTLATTDNITARVDVPLYYRSVASTAWNLASTWEVSSDPAFISPAPVAASVAPTNNNSAGIQISNGTIVGIATAVTADDINIVSGGVLSITANGLTIANGTAANDCIIASGGTLQYSSTAVSVTVATGASLQVNGLLKNNGANNGVSDTAENGTITVTSTGTYEHARSAGRIPTATWNTGSTCLISGTIINAPSGLAQAFHHFTVNVTLGSSVNTSGALQTINGKFKLTTNHASNMFALGSGTAFTLTVGDSLIVNNGILNITNGTGTAAVVANGPVLVTGASSKLTKANATTATWTFNNNFTMNAGTFEMNEAGSSNTTVNFLGNVTFASGTSFLRTNGGTHIVNFVRSTGQQDFSMNATQGAGAIAYNIGNGTSTNTVRITSSTWTLSTSAHSISVNTNATLDMQAAVITGTSTAFTTQTGSTLRIGHPQGIASGTTAQGNVQTNGTRSFNGAANYVYSGTVNQITGTGLPATITGQLSVANTGAVSNNTVTLTTNNTTTAALNLQSGLFAAGTGQNINISNGGVVNDTGGDFATGATAGRVTAVGSATFNGTSNPYEVYASGAVNFGAQTVTIQNGGVFRINSGGSASINAPFYASGSTLQYASGGTYGRNIEWSATSGRGYPHHVELLNNTTLNPANTGATQANTPMRTGGNLTINSGSAVFMDFGANNMIEDLIVGGSVFLTGSLSGSGASGSDIFVAGDWTNNGTAPNFFPNSRAVFFNGTGTQTISGTNTSFPVFDFVLIDKTAGSVVLARDVQVGSGLTFTTTNTAIVDATSFTLFVSANGTGAINRQGLGHVKGNLRRAINTGSNTYVFHVGDATVYSPASLALNNVTGAGSITASVTNTDQTQLTSSGLDNTKSVNRFWTLSSTGLTLTSFDPTFTFVAGDLDAGVNTSNLLVGRFNSGWTYPTVGTRTATTTQATGLTAYGDFALAECKQPTAYAVTGGGSYCAGGSGVAVGLANSEAFVSYQLQVNGSNTGSPVLGTGSAISFGNQLTAGTYTVIASNLASFGCLDTMTGSVLVSILPTVTPAVTITASPANTICAGSSVTFEATPQFGGLTPIYQWKVNGSNVGTNDTLYTTSSLVNGDVVTCVMTSSEACPSPSTGTSNAITMTVLPFQVPVVTITANPGTTACSGEPVTFTASPTFGGGAPAYQWQVNGINSGSNSDTFVASTLTTGNVIRVIMTSNYQCLSTPVDTSNVLTMTMTAAPQVDAGTPMTTCGGSPYTFANGASTSNISSRLWTHNGAGSISGATTLTPTYTPSSGEASTGATVTFTLTGNGNSPCGAVTDQVVLTITPLLLYYVDADLDGFGNPLSTPIASCTPIAGRTTDNTDCCDTNADINPMCEWWADMDGDGWGSFVFVTGCVSGCSGNAQTIPWYPPAHGGASYTPDCNDNSTAVYPGAPEICQNNIDNDCDGTIDEGCSGIPNDTYANAQIIVTNTANAYYPNCQTTSGTVVNADISAQANPANVAAGGGRDVWFRFTAVSTAAQIKVTPTNTAPSNFNPVIELRTAAHPVGQVDVENLVGNDQTEIMNVSGLTIGLTYYVAVRNFNNANVGSFTICVSSLMPSGCAYTVPAGGFNLCNNYKAIYRGATSYTFNFTGTGGTAPLVSTAASAASGLIALSNTGLALRWGGIYTARVDANYTLLNGAGTADPTITILGNPASSNCTGVSIMAQPLMTVRTNQTCPTILLRTNYLIGNTTAGNSSVCSAISYTYRFTQVTNCSGTTTAGLPFEVTTTGNTPYLMLAQAFPTSGGFPMPNLGYWRVEIRPNFSYGQGSYGPPSVIQVNNTSLSAMLEDNGMIDEAERSVELISDAAIYPNPTSGELVNVNLVNLTAPDVTVRITDALGRVVYNKQFVAEGSLNTVLVFDQELNQGIYTVEFINGSAHLVERLVVQR